MLKSKEFTKCQKKVSPSIPKVLLFSAFMQDLKIPPSTRARREPGRVLDPLILLLHGTLLPAYMHPCLLHQPSLELIPPDSVFTPY